MRQKVFVYVVRPPSRGHELLCLASHDEPGFEVPKGAVEPSEPPQEAVSRELLEETGLTRLPILAHLGTTSWEDEIQAFYVVGGSPEIPATFTHQVTGCGGDQGLVYAYEWMDVTPRLSMLLVQGCGALAAALVAWSRCHRPTSAPS